MIKLIPWMLAFAVPVQLAFGQTSLDEVLQQISSAAPEYALRELIPEQTRYEVKNAGNAWKPQLGISGQATYQSHVTFLNVEVPGFTVPQPDRFQYKVQGEVTQLLYDGGRIGAASEAARARGLIESAQLEIQLEQLRMNTISIYFSILEVEEMSAIISLRRENIEARRQVMIAGVREGVTLRSELLQMDAALVEADQEITRLKIQRQSLINKLGLLSGQEYDEGTEFLRPDNLVLSDSGKGRLAYHNLLDQQEKAIQVTQEVKDAGSNPQLIAFGNLGLGRPGLNFLDESLSDYYIFGLRMQMQFGQLYSKGNDRQINRIKSERIIKSRAVYDRQWQSELDAYYLDISMYDTQIEANTSLLTLREDISRVARAQLDNGVINASEYILRVNEESAARFNLSLSELRKLKTLYLIEHHTGNYSRKNNG